MAGVSHQPHTDCYPYIACARFLNNVNDEYNSNTFSLAPACQTTSRVRRQWSQRYSTSRVRRQRSQRYSYGPRVYAGQLPAMGELAVSTVMG